MTTNTLFVILFVVFIGILVGCGFYAKRWVSEAADYVLAGREVSTFINMMGVIAIGFAGTTVALAPGFSIMYGFKNSAIWGLVYGICGLLLYGVLWGKFVRLNGAQTLPEYLEMRYSPAIRPIIAVTSVIGMCGILANNIVSCVSSIVGFTGWNTTYVTAVIFLVIIVFTFISGLWAATITDFFQVCLGVVAVPLMLSLLVNRFGGLEAVASNWLGGDWINVGIDGGTVPAMALTYPSYLNFIICFAAALVWGNNYYCYQADLTDYMGVDSAKAAASVEKLDQGGLIQREGMTGTKFYTYSITEKGEAALKPLSGAEAEMAREGLTPMYLDLLSIVKNAPERQAEFIKKYSIRSMQMAAISSHLTRKGYILEKGLFKRKLAITDKGIAAVKKYDGAAVG